MKTPTHPANPASSPAPAEQAPKPSVAASAPVLEDRHFPEEARHVMRMVRHAPPDQVFFLTGVAGSGKTTLLRHILRTLPAGVNAAVLAPTGVAAVRAGGQTIHSFFKYSAKPFTREQVPFLNVDQLLIIRELNLLVIDEISMVRADLLDCVDESLRRALRRPDRPFGGLCLLLVGDLSQLPPVVATDADRDILSHRYVSEFFFDAHVFEQVQLQVLNLKTVHRQAGDPNFLRILERVRMAEATEDDMAALSAGSKFRGPNDPLPPANEELPLTLCPTNAQVDYLNDRYLNNLPGPIQKVAGQIEGEFPRKAFPVEEVLMLKPGCLLMMQVADSGAEPGEKRRWLNGTRCTLLEVVKENPKDEYSAVRCLRVSLRRPGCEDDEEPEEFELGRHEFEAVKYRYDRMAGKVIGEIIGKFRQFPVRLAYACTIHKAQGETHNRVHLDLGNGTFASGQLYVALSRCRTLAGISLARKVWLSDQKLEPRVKGFLKLLETTDSATAEDFLNTSRANQEAILLGARPVEDDEPGLDWSGRVTPADLSNLTLAPGQVLVFPSNLAGRHGAGLAKLAAERHGAIYGNGEGPQGDCYALPTREAESTKGSPVTTMSLPSIAKNVRRFLEWAASNPEQTFLVPKIGCGLAGYRPRQIAELFYPAELLPPNVHLPLEFWQILDSFPRVR